MQQQDTKSFLLAEDSHNSICKTYCYPSTSPNQKKFSFQHASLLTVSCAACGRFPLPSVAHGPAWKCLNCVDYFICAVCEEKRSSSIYQPQQCLHQVDHVFVYLPYPGLLPEIAMQAPLPVVYTIDQSTGLPSLFH